MKVFLTGGTGFIGQELVKTMRTRGWDITALVRKPDASNAKVLEKLGAVLVQGDVTNRESMRSGMTGADVVIHNAGVYEIGVDASAATQMRTINVQGTENTLGLALELDIPRTLYVSTVWAFGDSGSQSRDETFIRNTKTTTVYEQTKFEAHNIAISYCERGLPLIIVCPNGVIGANDHSIFGYLVRLYLNNLLPPMAWSPDVMLTLVDVQDLTEGMALAVEKGQIGETYLLTGEAHNRTDMFVHWAGFPGGAKSRAYLPPRLMSLMFTALEPVERAVGLPAIFSRESVSVGSSNLNFSSAKAQQELGWTYRSAKEMWANTLRAEQELLKIRKSRDWRSRIRPVSD